MNVNHPKRFVRIRYHGFVMHPKENQTPLHYVEIFLAVLHLSRLKRYGNATDTGKLSMASKISGVNAAVGIPKLPQQKIPLWDFKSSSFILFKKASGNAGIYLLMPCLCKISNCATIISEIAFLYWEHQNLKAHIPGGYSDAYFVHFGIKLSANERAVSL